MGKNFGDFHVLSITILGLVMFILPFLTDNPLILSGIFIIILGVYAARREFGRLVNGLKLFIPFFLLTFVINMLFAQEGMTVLFRVWGKSFTLEATVNSLLLSFKLLLVVFVFSAAGMMVDSDKAAAYFSSIAPKSTLMIMVGIKLIPSMKKRFKSLVEIYSVRGVDYEGKKMKEKIKSYIPVLSILLEDSLEGAFDIGEAVYVRGFLSGSRSVYDRQRWKVRDSILVSICAVVVCAFVFYSISGLNRFNPYISLSVSSFINSGAVIVFISLMAAVLAIFYVGEN